MNELYNDKSTEFAIVIEQTTPQDGKLKIISEGTDTLNFLRFETCLQSFNGYNRNRRLWLPEHVKIMSESKEVREAISRGAFVGESGHPCSSSADVTMKRIYHIDPLRCSHRVIGFKWVGNELHGIVETLDDGPGGPGYMFKRNIMQGIQPAFSLRSVVPQRKNKDGSIDVMGPGRMICYDRVYIPSHEEAYININVPIKDIVKKSEFTSVMEEYCGDIMKSSDKVNRILDNMDPAMESASYDHTTQTISVNTNEGRIFIVPEIKHRKDIGNFLNSF